MSTTSINGTVVTLGEDGYMTDHSEWNREIADGLAKEEGITLTEAHWKVLDFIGKDFGEKGVVPGMRRMNKVGGIPTKELYALFPNGPIKKAARIAGYPKPASCV